MFYNHHQSHPGGRLSHPKGRLSHPGGRLSHPKGLLSHPVGRLSHRLSPKGRLSRLLSYPRGQIDFKINN